MVLWGTRSQWNRKGSWLGFWRHLLHSLGDKMASLLSSSCLLASQHCHVKAQCLQLLQPAWTDEEHIDGHTQCGQRGRWKGLMNYSASEVPYLWTSCPVRWWTYFWIFLFWFVCYFQPKTTWKDCQLWWPILDLRLQKGMKDRKANEISFAKKVFWNTKGKSVPTKCPWPCPPSHTWLCVCSFL